MSQITRATLPAASPLGRTRNVSRSGRSTISDSSIRTKPSIDEPSNMMSPSSAFSNWLSGTSTFLLTPRMSVNWSLSELMSCFLATSRISRLVVIEIRGGKGAVGVPPPTAPYTPYRQLSGVVIQEELVRMRPERHRVDILDSLHREPGIDEILREDAPVEQEGMVGFERRQRLLQASRRVLHVLALRRLQVVQIDVHRLGRLDLVFDAVETRHEQRGEREVRVGRWIRRPELEPLGLRRGRIHRDAANRRAVALRVNQVDRRLVARYEPAVAVRRRGRKGKQGSRVLDQPADVPPRRIRNQRVPVLVEEQVVRAVPQAHVHVHPRAVVAEHRLRHERR